MRVAELGRVTGVPIPTIKYYLREGLLPPGARIGPNQASYGQSHVRRIRMIRTLVDVGGLSIAATKDVLAAMNRQDGMPAVLEAMATGTGPVVAEEEPATTKVAELLAPHGLAGLAHTTAGRSLLAAVTALYELDRTDLLALLEPLTELCVRLAEVEAAAVRCHDDLEGVVIGTMLGDVVMSSIRRMAKYPTLTSSPGRT
jgi:DNA-binding transcriptional MerR regulator